MASRTSFRERLVDPDAGFRAGPRRVALAYPSPWRAAASSLGYQQILRVMRQAGLSVERVVLPEKPGEVPRSIETGTPLGSFPLVAVSFAYELEILGLVRLLDASGIPPLAVERDHHHPLIMLGGPISMAGPAFLDPIADVVMLGEAEATAPAAARAFFDADDVAGWFDAVQTLPGGHVPSRGRPMPPSAVADDEELPARSVFVSPEAELADMFLIEGERGCHRQCTFCVMRRGETNGMRRFDLDRIRAMIPDDERKIGLVGAAISDHPELVPLLDALVAEGRQVSVSSLRADRIMRRPGIARALRKSGARTLTVASDGASAAVRRSIMKGTTEEHLLACAAQASELRFETLKIYMMLGVPGETDADVDELIAFTLALAERAKPARVVLGVAPFVAKRNTPLDGLPFAGIDLVDDRVRRVRRGLGGRATVRAEPARWAWVEHRLAQGGGAEGVAMVAAARAGGTFRAVEHALRSVVP